MFRNKSDRLIHIDYIRGCAILLVIIGHYIQECFDSFSDHNSNAYSIFEVIYAFHMPLFFIISGYVIALKEPDLGNLKKIGIWLFKKGQLLIFPMFIWKGLIYPIVNHSDLTFLGLLDSLLHPFPLWFCQTLFFVFFGYVIFRYCHQKINNIIVQYVGLPFGIIISVILYTLIKVHTISFTEVMSLLLYTSFYYVGFIINKMPIVEKIVKENRLLQIFLFIVLIVCLYLYDFDASSMINKVYKYGASISLFLLASVCFSDIYLPKLLSKYLLKCSSHSLSIYCVHFLLIWDFIKISTDSVLVIITSSIIASLIISLIIIGFATLLSPLKYVSILMFGRVNK